MYNRFQDQFLDLFLPLVRSLPDPDKVKELEVVIATEESRKGQERGSQEDFQQQYQKQQSSHSQKLQFDDATASTGDSRGAIAPDSVLVNSSDNNDADILTTPQATSGFNEEEKRVPKVQPQKFKQKSKGRGGSASTWATAIRNSGVLSSKKVNSGISIVKAKDIKSRRAANAKLSVNP